MDSSHLRLLDALRENRSRWLPARDLADRLEVSRAKLKAALHSLASSGYEIEAHPQLGYRLLVEPEHLIAKELFPERPTGGIPSEIIVEESVESTMDSVWALAARGAPHGTTVFAEEQTQGRGRLGREWAGGHGKGLMFSTLLRSAGESGAGHLLVTAAAIAAARTLQGTCCLPAQIKWPNDIVIYGKKLCGILLERRPATSHDAWVLGIGLNINQTDEDFPPEVIPQATSIRMETGSPASRELLGRELLAELGVWYGVFERNDLHLIETSWMNFSSTIGERVEIDEGGKTYAGRVVGLSPLQGLLVQLAPGGLRSFRSEQLSLRVLADPALPD